MTRHIAAVISEDPADLTEFAAAAQQRNLPNLRVEVTRGVPGLITATTIDQEQQLYVHLFTRIDPLRWRGLSLDAAYLSSGFRSLLHAQEPSYALEVSLFPDGQRFDLDQAWPHLLGVPR